MTDFRAGLIILQEPKRKEMFDKILKFIASTVKGVRVLAVFDKDGIIVSKLDSKERAADEIAAEFSSVLKYIDKVTTFLITGRMEKMYIDCETEGFYLHKINNFYYIVAVIDKSAILGKLKYVISSLEPKFRKELDF